MSPEDEKEERDIIFSLDSYVILEYIKSSVDIILNLKFEEIEKKLIDKNHSLGEKSSKHHKDRNNTDTIKDDTLNSPNP